MSDTDSLILRGKASVLNEPLSKVMLEFLRSSSLRANSPGRMETETWA